MEEPCKVHLDVKDVDFLFKLLQDATKEVISNLNYGRKDEQTLNKCISVTCENVRKCCFNVKGVDIEKAHEKLSDLEQLSMRVQRAEDRVRGLRDTVPCDIAEDVCKQLADFRPSIDTDSSFRLTPGKKKRQRLLPGGSDADGSAEEDSNSFDHSNKKSYVEEIHDELLKQADEFPSLHARLENTVGKLSRVLEAYENTKGTRLPKDDALNAKAED